MSNRTAHILLLVGLVVLGLAIIWVCLNTQKNKKKNEELEKYIADLYDRFGVEPSEYLQLQNPVNNEG